MADHPLKRRIERREIALGAWATIPSPVSSEIAGATGFDYVCVDMQHGLVGYRDSLQMLQAIGIGGSTPLVRVPANHTDHIGKALDAGALGVIVPMVNSPGEAEAAMHSVRYPPLGSRSHGPARALPLYGPDYRVQSETDVLLIPMIETVAAVESIDEILEVPTIQAIYVGPSDLGISMGLAPGEEKPSFHDALDEIVAACERHGVTPGIHTTLATVHDRLARGYRMVTIISDLVALRTKLADDLKAVRRGESSDESDIY